jgi:hypothetical protein
MNRQLGIESSATPEMEQLLEFVHKGDPEKPVVLEDRTVVYGNEADLKRIDLYRFDGLLRIMPYKANSKRSCFIEFKDLADEECQYGRVDRIRVFAYSAELHVAVLNTRPLILRNPASTVDNSQPGCSLSHVLAVNDNPFETDETLLHRVIVQPRQVLAMCCLYRNFICVVPAVQLGST